MEIETDPWVYVTNYGHLYGEQRQNFSYEDYKRKILQTRPINLLWRIT